MKSITKFCFRIFCQKVIGEKKPIPFLKFQYVLISKLSPTNCLELCKSHQFSVLQMTWKIIFWYEKVLIDCPCLWGYHIRLDQGHVRCKFQLLIISHSYPYLLATWKTSSVKGLPRWENLITIIWIWKCTFLMMIKLNWFYGMVDW